MQKNLFQYTIIFLSTAFLIGCAKDDYTLDLSSKSNIYKKAFQDGCTTAEEKYTKNHHLFKNNQEYYNGWFAGRQYCEHYPLKQTK